MGATSSARVRLLLTAFTVFGFVPGLQAGTLKYGPLPPFSFVDGKGQAVAYTSAVAQPGRWLIIYVQPNCRPCDGMLSLLQKAGKPELAKKVVIVLGHTSPAETNRIRQRYPQLSQADWYGDPSNGAYHSLKLMGAPSVIGVDRREVRWSLAGLLPSSADTRRTLLDWIDPPAKK